MTVVGTVVRIVTLTTMGTKVTSAESFRASENLQSSANLECQGAKNMQTAVQAAPFHYSSLNFSSE
jgi:hypothetical protein